jgi:hypothetical protein
MSFVSCSLHKITGRWLTIASLGGRGVPHRPVLLRETMGFLAPERGGLFADGTVGLGRRWTRREDLCRADILDVAKQLRQSGPEEGRDWLPADANKAFAYYKS